MRYSDRGEREDWGDRGRQGNLLRGHMVTSETWETGDTSDTGLTGVTGLTNRTDTWKKRSRK